MKLVFTLIKPFAGAYLRRRLRSWVMGNGHRMRTCWLPALWDLCGRCVLWDVCICCCMVGGTSFPFVLQTDATCFLAKVPVHTMGMEEASDHAMWALASQDQHPRTSVRCPCTFFPRNKDTYLNVYVPCGSGRSEGLSEGHFA